MDMMIWDRHIIWDFRLTWDFAPSFKGSYRFSLNFTFQPFYRSESVNSSERVIHSQLQHLYHVVCSLGLRLFFSQGSSFDIFEFALFLQKVCVSNSGVAFERHGYLPGRVTKDVIELHEGSSFIWSLAPTRDRMSWPLLHRFGRFFLFYFVFFPAVLHAQYWIAGESL